MLASGARAAGAPLIRVALIALLLLPLALVSAFAGVGPLDDCARREAPLPPCNVWASRPPTGPANEVHIAVNPLDPRHLLAVAKDYSLGANGDCRPGGAWHVGSASYVTFDGGLTWSVARVPAPYPNGGAEPSPLAWKCGSDPVAMFGPDGTAYYLVLNFQYAGARQASIAVARSPDGGLTWPASDIRVVHTSGGDDKEWGAVGNDGTVHVVWTDVNNGRIYYARSLPGWTFETPRVLATAGFGNPAVTVDTGPSGEVYVVWRDGGSIKFVRSADFGASFGSVRVAFTTSPYEQSVAPRLPFMPQLAVDDSPASPFAGSVYVVWPRATGVGDADAYLAYSRDGGATWSAHVRVSDDASARRQVMPTVAVAPNGRVDVAWLDQRLSPTLDFWTAFLAQSTDGGASFLPNRQAQEVPLFEEWSYHQDGSIFIGDYIGVASTDAHAYPIFPGNGPERAGALAPLQMRRADAYVAVLDSRALQVAPAPGAQAAAYPSVEVPDDALPAIGGPH